eukprot:287784-Pyramimonas_sp.AAC.1
MARRRRRPSSVVAVAIVVVVRRPSFVALGRRQRADQHRQARPAERRLQQQGRGAGQEGQLGMRANL